jgi:hypothetical protein
MSLESLEPRLGRPLAGVLGHDFIRHFVIEVDYPGRRLRFHDPARFSYAGQGVVLAIELDAGHPFVAARLRLGPGTSGRSIEGRLLVDTGADLTLLLSSPFVKRHELLSGEARRIRHYSHGVGGDTCDWVGRLAALELGGLKFTDPLVVFSESTGGATASPDYAGILGGQVLERFRTFLDYPGRKLILEPGPRAFQPFDHDMSGLQLMLRSGEIVVERVIEATPAAEAGLEPGDVLVAVAGVAAAEIALPALRHRLKQPGQSLAIELRRAGAHARVTLETRKLV